jgi:oxygen-independent coproporphyrinogen-3 oxidase
MTPLGIYVQVPFCQTSCTYCNFHTGVVSSARYAPYALSVCREIRGRHALYASAGIAWPATFSEAVVDTVYFGGGTPSLLDPAHLAEILRAIRETFACELHEVTLEADPETVTAAKASAWASAGINRVSFGAQSFSDRELAAAGRLHRRADVHRAFPLLRSAGIKNISCDLIAGLPHQTAASWEASLSELLLLEPEHVSIYLLEIDDGSRLGREVLKGGHRYSACELPAEDQMADFYESAQRKLQNDGFHHYEISNWAKPGYESRHNLKYWRRDPYLGFGAGAHSFSGTQRWANAHDPAHYVAAIEANRLPSEQLETVTPEQALEEELFLGLRQLDGIDVAGLEARYHAAIEPRLVSLFAAGLLERRDALVRLAPRRLSVSNEVFVELLR